MNVFMYDTSVLMNTRVIPTYGSPRKLPSRVSHQTSGSCSGEFVLKSSLSIMEGADAGGQPFGTGAHTL